MDLKLSDQQFHDLVQKSLFDSMSQETRDELLRKAIQQAISGTPVGGPGSTYVQRSELQRAFDLAVSAVVRKMVDEMIENDPNYIEKIRAVVVDGFNAIFSDTNRAKTVERVSEAISKGIWGDRY